MAAPITVQEPEKGPHPVIYCALAAFIMAYGWGYRGTVGHEAGAMAPGAMLGLALCLGSCRLDWQRRAAVAGLFGAIGWAWGGSLSYMEHTAYVMSDSFVDVLYGYSMLFFLGALWAGIGGGVLGLAFSEPRSELERLIRPFTAICAVFLTVYVYFFFVPEHAEAYETLTVRYFHDGDWLAATLTLTVSAVYWLARPKDRPATALFFWGAVAWWIGYLGFTKFGGLRLAPLHRSESWGGVVGVLVVLILYLLKRQNRAALMLCLYGIVGGGLAFALAVFIRHPLAAHWGPFEGTWPQWRVAEDSFGFFMGLAIALGARRFLRGGIVPPQEDTPRAPLDVYAVFVMLVALLWINFRRHAEAWIAKADASGANPWVRQGAAAPCLWLVLGGALATAPFLYGLNRYLRGDRRFVPQSSFGKGVAVALILVWVTVAGYFLHDLPKPGNIRQGAAAPCLTGHLLLWVPAMVATCLLLSFLPRETRGCSPLPNPPREAIATPSDPKWTVGVGYGLVWGWAPIFLLCITTLSMAMQEGSPEGMGRKRFGPDAYWRRTARLMGTWQAIGMAQNLQARGYSPLSRAEDLPVKRLEFDQYRNVTATMASGEIVAAHQWFLKNQYFWLYWYGKADDHPERAEVPLEFRGQRLYIAWPPRQGAAAPCLVFERVGG